MSVAKQEIKEEVLNTMDETMVDDSLEEDFILPSQANESPETANHNSTQDAYLRPTISNTINETINDVSGDFVTEDVELFVDNSINPINKLGKQQSDDKLPYSEDLFGSQLIDNSIVQATPLFSRISTIPETPVNSAQCQDDNSFLNTPHLSRIQCLALRSQVGTSHVLETGSQLADTQPVDEPPSFLNGSPLEIITSTSYVGEVVLEAPTNFKVEDVDHIIPDKNGEHFDKPTDVSIEEVFVTTTNDYNVSDDMPDIVFDRNHSAKKNVSDAVCREAKKKNNKFLSDSVNVILNPDNCTTEEHLSRLGGNDSLMETIKIMDTSVNSIDISNIESECSFVCDQLIDTVVKDSDDAQKIIVVEDTEKIKKVLDAEKSVNIVEKMNEIMGDGINISSIETIKIINASVNDIDKSNAVSDCMYVCNQLIDTVAKDSDKAQEVIAAKDPDIDKNTKSADTRIVRSVNIVEKVETIKMMDAFVSDIGKVENDCSYVCDKLIEAVVKYSNDEAATVKKDDELKLLKRTLSVDEIKEIYRKKANMLDAYMLRKTLSTVDKRQDEVTTKELEEDKSPVVHISLDAEEIIVSPFQNTSAENDQTTSDSEASTEAVLTPQSDDVSRNAAVAAKTQLSKAPRPLANAERFKFVIDVECEVVRDTNTNAIIEKKIIEAKVRLMPKPGEEESEKESLSKRESLSSAGSVYSDKTGLPYQLKPRISVASTMSSSTSASEENHASRDVTPKLSELLPWRNDVRLALACDEALVRRMDLGSSPSIMSSPASRMLLTNEAPLQKIKQNRFDPCVSKENSIELKNTLSKHETQDKVQMTATLDCDEREEMADFVAPLHLSKSTPKRTRRAVRLKGRTKGNKNQKLVTKEHEVTSTIVSNNSPDRKLKTDSIKIKDDNVSIASLSSITLDKPAESNDSEATLSKKTGRNDSSPTASIETPKTDAVLSVMKNSRPPRSPMTSATRAGRQMRQKADVGTPSALELLSSPAAAGGSGVMKDAVPRKDSTPSKRINASPPAETIEAPKADAVLSVKKSRRPPRSPKTSATRTRQTSQKAEAEHLGSPSAHGLPSTPALAGPSRDKKNAVPCQDANKFAPDAAVFARWTDGYYYPGTLQSRVGDKWVVKYADGQSKTIAGHFIFLQSLLKEGHCVMVDHNRGSHPAFITSISSKNYTVEMEGKKSSIKVTQMRLTVEQVNVVFEDQPAKSLLLTPSSRAVVDPDNIVSVRRRASSGESSTPSTGSRKRRRIHSPPLQNTEWELTPGLDIDETVAWNMPNIKSISKSRRNILKSIPNDSDEAALETKLGPIPSSTSNIFANVGFLLCCVKPKPRLAIKRASKASDSEFSMSESEDVSSYDKYNKFPFDIERLRKQITAGGGMVYENFQSIPSSKYATTKLVTNRPNRSAKFILCLVHGIEIVLHLHVIEACNGKDFSSAKLHHAGWSESAMRWVDRSPKIHKTFLGKNLHLFSKSQDTDADRLYTAFWSLVVKKAGGSITEDLNYDVIVTDSSLPSEVRDAVDALGDNGPLLVSANWVLECIMHGTLLKPAQHPSFIYNYESSISS